MQANNFFLLSFKKLAVLLLPTMMRKSAMSALTQLFMSPICSVHTSLLKYRIDTTFRLTHNSQVCYLRAALNDKFDAINRKIQIIDAEAKEPIVVYLRKTVPPCNIPQRANNKALVLSARGYSGINGYDFVVQVPADIYTEDNIKYIEALTNQFKLASKQFNIITLS